MKRHRPSCPNAGGQRGQGLIIAAVLMITVVAFAVSVVGRMSAGQTRDTYYFNQSLQALMLAESGVEYALKQFVAGTACTSLGSASTYALASGDTGTFQIVSGATSDLTGTAFPAYVTTRCKVTVTGLMASTKVSRTIQAVIDKNLIGGLANPDFNVPGGTSTPTGWGFSAGQFDTLGGPDDVSATQSKSCSTSAYNRKTGTSAVSYTRTQTLTAQFSVVPSVANPTILTVAFDYRVNSDQAPASDTNPPQFGFQVRAGGGTFSSTFTSGGSTISPYAFKSPIPTGSPPYTTAPYSPCDTGYPGIGTATPTSRGSVTITITGTGSTKAVDQAGFTLNNPANSPTDSHREMWLDNIEITDTTPAGVTAKGSARVVQWLDCSAAAGTPSACL